MKYYIHILLIKNIPSTYIIALIFNKYLIGLIIINNKLNRILRNHSVILHYRRALRVI